MIPQRARLWMNLEDWSDVIVHSLSISGGRERPTGKPDSATVTITIALPKAKMLPTIGDRVDIAGWVISSTLAKSTAALFTGRITDVALEMGANIDGGDVLSLVAADMFRELDGVNVTMSDYGGQGMAWATKVDDVWGAAQTALGNPQWMANDSPTANNDYSQVSLVDMQYDGTPEPTEQPALSALNHLFDQVAHVVYYQPHRPGGGVLAPEPGDWQPGPHAVSLFHESILQTNYPVPASLIRADVIPRYSANLSGVANDITLTALDVAAGVKPYIYRETGGDPAQHGHITKHIDTEIPALTSQDAPNLLHAYLARLQWPGLDLDSVRLSWRDGHVDDLEGEAWEDVLKFGPIGTGLPLSFEGLPAGFADPARPGWNIWIVEGMTVTLMPDGWDIDLSLSHPGYYSGGIPPTPDPRHSYAELPVKYATYDALLAATPTYTDLLGV